MKQKKPPPKFQTAFSQTSRVKLNQENFIHQAFNNHSRSENLLETSLINQNQNQNQLQEEANHFLSNFVDSDSNHQHSIDHLINPSIQIQNPIDLLIPNSTTSFQHDNISSNLNFPSIPSPHLSPNHPTTNPLQISIDSNLSSEKLNQSISNLITLPNQSSNLNKSNSNVTLDSIPTKRPHQSIPNKYNKKTKLPPQIFIKSRSVQLKKNDTPHHTNPSSNLNLKSIKSSTDPNLNSSQISGIKADQIQIWKKIQHIRSQRLTSLSKNSSIAEFHLDRLEKQWNETLRQAGTLSSAIELKNQVENYQELIKKIQHVLGEELVRVQIEESILRHVRGIIADRLTQIQEWNHN